MLEREKFPAKAKANKVMAKVPSLSGDQHAKTTGSQAVAHKAIIVQGIIREDSQAGVQSVVLLSMLLLSVPVQLSPKPRMLSGTSPLGPMRKRSGLIINGSLKSMKSPRARKEKGKDLSQRGSLRARVPRDRLLQGPHSLHRRKVSDPNPKPNLKHDNA